MSDPKGKPGSPTDSKGSDAASAAVSGGAGAPAGGGSLVLAGPPAPLPGPLASAPGGPAAVGAVGGVPAPAPPPAPRPAAPVPPVAPAAPAPVAPAAAAGGVTAATAPVFTALVNSLFADFGKIQMVTKPRYAEQAENYFRKHADAGILVLAGLKAACAGFRAESWGEGKIVFDGVERGPYKDIIPGFGVDFVVTNKVDYRADDPNQPLTLKTLIKVLAGSGVIKRYLEADHRREPAFYRKNSNTYNIDRVHSYILAEHGATSAADAERVVGCAVVADHLSGAGGNARSLRAQRVLLARGIRGFKVPTLAELSRAPGAAGAGAPVGSAAAPAPTV